MIDLTIGKGNSTIEFRSYSMMRRKELVKTTPLKWLIDYIRLEFSFRHSMKIIYFISLFEVH